MEILEKVKQDEIIRPFETVRQCKDGSLIDVSITVSAVKDAMGRVIGVSAIAHDLRDRKQVEMELRKLSARLLKMQDETRRDMARELHDSVIQGLAAAVINLSMMKDSTHLLPQARKTLEETLKITEEAVREIRTFSYLLHPPLLDVTGLQSALRWYVEGYSKRSGIQVELDLPEGRGRMAKEVELTLFRIVQEALTNIHRHSGGGRATICMRRTTKELSLAISDDGRGMDAETLKKVKREGAVLGVGIAGMKQRLQQLGGRLDISSSNKGTSVTATLPISRL
jgi:signal transduction histidine kinase